MKPHVNNYCGGNFTDWLEVLLTPACDGRCSWCVEKHGWHPTEVAPTEKLIQTILDTNKQHVILLGGEPTLHKDLKQIVETLADAGREVYITTHGGHLTWEFVERNLQKCKGINISIHSDKLDENKLITGISLNFTQLWQAIGRAHQYDIKIRFNCNLIKGHIDSKERIYEYIGWAKWAEADSVRFAELKFEDDKFIDLAEIFNHEHGLNDNPYLLGCNTNTVIDGMPVNFRQMCGLQTSQRPRPEEPELCRERCVVYYDGNTYDGWQTEDPKNIQKGLILSKLLDLQEGKITKQDLLNYFTESTDA